MEIKNSPLFELVSYKDLFDKAQYDFSKLDELVNSYDLFNFLCTINHLYDWVKHETNLENPLCHKDGEPLNTIRLLCGRAKHFKKRPTHPDTQAQSGYGIGRYGVGGYGVGEPSYTVNIDGKDVSVLDLCNAAIDAWRKFLVDNNLL